MTKSKREQQALKVAKGDPSSPDHDAFQYLARLRHGTKLSRRCFSRHITAITDNQMLDCARVGTVQGAVSEENIGTNHTGKELPLMLEGKKPLSMFYDDADEERDERIIPEVAFGKLAAIGQLSKAERIFELAYDQRIGRNRRIRYVLYCLKGQEWRLEAMFLVAKAVLNTPHYDEGLDRMAGYLLGYTDDEVEAHIASRTKGR